MIRNLTGFLFGFIVITLLLFALDVSADNSVNIEKKEDPGTQKIINQIHINNQSYNKKKGCGDDCDKPKVKIVYKTKVVYRDRIVYRDRPVVKYKTKVKVKYKKKIKKVYIKPKRNALSLIGGMNPTKIGKVEDTNFGHRVETEHQPDIGLMYQHDFSRFRFSIGGTMRGFGFIGGGFTF